MDNHNCEFMKPISYHLIIVFILLLSFNCKGQQYSVENIPLNLISNAYAVIRTDNTHVEVLDQNEMIVYKEKAITVLNKKAKTLLDFDVYFSESSEKIEDIDLRYYDNLGNEIKKIKKKEISDNATYDGFTFITDTRKKSYEYEGNEYPLTIHYTYKKISNTTCFIPRWQPIRTSKVSIEQSDYVLTNRTNTAIHSNEFRLKEFNCTKEGEFAYSLNSFEAFNIEKYMPQLNHIYPKVDFVMHDFSYENIEGSAKTWEDFGKWVYESFLSQRKDLSKIAIKNQLKEIISPEDSQKDIVKKLYKFIQDNTRYVGIQLAEGGYKPMSSKDVDTYKYGDCKGLSFYMMNLLNAYDINSNYVLVHADSDSKTSLNEKKFGHAQLNHVIVNVPLDTDTIWLDCTSDYEPFNMLGTFTDGRKVLEISKDNYKVIETPCYGKDLNQSIEDIQITLSENLDAEINFAKDYYGIQYSDIIILNQMGQEKYNDYLKEEIFDKFNDVELKSTSFDFDESQFIAHQNVAFNSSNFGEAKGDFLQIPVRFLKLGVPYLKKDKKRNFEIQFNRSKREKSFVTYSLPTDFRLLEDFEKIQWESEFGYYSLEISQNKDKLKIEKVFELNEGIYSSKSYNSIKLFFDKIRKQEQSLITLEKRT